MIDIFFLLNIYEYGDVYVLYYVCGCDLIKFVMVEKRSFLF